MKIYFTLLLLLAGSLCAFAQHTLKGKITTVQNQPLDGAHIHIGQLHATTLPDGTYTLTGIGSGNQHVVVSYIGYKSVVKDIEFYGNETLNVNLQPESTQLQEVVLNESASQREKKSTANSVETVSSDYIRKNMGGSLMQSLDNIGGISTIAIGSGQSKPIIRGLGFNRVVVTESGIKHEGQQWGADHGLEIDQYAVGSVKLVKGPMSLLYGSDAIGGIIEIEKPKPPMPNTFGGSVELTGKSNNNLYGSSLNLYGRNHNYFFDARVTALDYADYKVPVDHINIYSYKAPLYKNRLRNTAGNELNLHLSTGYVADNFSSIFYISNLHTKSGLFANAHGLEPRNVNTGLHDASDRDIQNPYQDVDHFKIINRTKFKIGSNHFAEIEAGYQNNFRQEFSDYISHGAMSPVYPDYMVIPETLEREFNKNVYSLNARDKFTAGSHEITVGFNAEHQNNNSGGWGFIIPSYVQSSAGVFAYDKITFSQKLLLHLGARYDYGHIKTKNYFDWFATTVDGTPQYLQRAFAMSRSFNSPSWAVGLNYNLESWSFKANVGQSFRMPIVKELASNGVNYHQFSYELGNADLDAEKSYQLDLGASWQKNGFEVEVSPFLNYFPNYIYLNPTPNYDFAYGAGNQIFNYTQSRVLRYGGEVKANYTFYSHYTVGVVGEYVYSEQKSGPKKGFTLPFSPPASALFSFNYNTDIKNFKNLYAGIDYRLTARQNLIVPPENKTPGYSLINLSFGGDIPFYKQHITLNLQVQNLLNASNLNHTSFYRIIGVPDPGRNIVVSAKIPFTFK
ncbi:TonB-dependent receptor [Flavobacterium sp. Sd200]|uniref:TonB-dependent receptor n=1 Tax=Flavobacterium sp. Sd200 TaxID=2692211 RepID=UPI0013707135|nr:TonB-dependent receptor [Flavobacterium sp. Sd200]MXN93238.1 TonB-dependent receptor [Flavobacterium sp. Sd200]